MGNAFQKYINNSSPLLWECANKHKFHLSLGDVKNQGSWCRECMKLGLKFAQNLANERSWICLSDSYHNRCTPLSWKCSEGHLWFARIDSIQRETWCPYCVHEKARLGIEYAKKLANSKTESVYLMYIPTVQQLCSKSHEWYASINTIKNNNSWCPYCANTKLDILVAKDIAYSQGGECLSDSYIDCKSHLLWRCNKDHQWYATLSQVKNKNTWCPYCSKYKRERLCREIVSKYLGPPSKICQPDFLKNLKHPSGLHLDIYYPQYSLATEVQGRQHKHYIEHFHRTLE